MAGPERAQWAQGLLGRPLRNKWRLDRLIAYTDSGAVYAGMHRNGREVAIKVLAPQLAGDEAVRARFLREGYVSNRLRHPGAVAILDDDVSEDGYVFLVMELLIGETLHARWLRQGMRANVEELLSTVDQLLDVLAAAHELGIVHRDVKPQNVMLLQSGGVKLLDFGLALLPQAERDVWALPDVAFDAVTSLTMGTPAFMPPEQAIARWDLVDGRADVWSVGAMMFTLLSGRHVHVAPDVHSLLMAAASQPAPPLVSVVPNAPAEVQLLVDRALAFNREARWPDARAMQRALRQARVANRALLEPVLVPPPIARPAAGSSATSAFGRIAPTIAFFLILGTVAIGMIWAFMTR